MMIVKFIKKAFDNIFFKLGLFPIALFFLTVISHIEWFNINSTLFYHDWQHRTGMAVSQIVNFGNATWLSYADLGNSNIQINAFFPLYAWGLVGDYDLAVKLTYLLPIALFSVLAPYYLLMYIVGDKKVSFLGALLYGFSIYLLERSTSHLPIAFVYSIAPIIILTFARLLRNFSAINMLIFVLSYSLGCFYEIRIMYIVSLILLIYFVIFFNKNRFCINKFRYIFLALLIIVINLFWLLPVLILDKQNFNDVMNRGIIWNKFFSMTYALSFFDFMWTGKSGSYDISLHTIKINNWIVPIISFFSLFQIKNETKNNKKYILFFASTLVIGLLLSKQSSEPFGNLYLWLYENFPGFSLFREASKFYLLTGIGYLGLFAFGIKYFTCLLNNKQVKLILFSVSVIVLLINIKPLVTMEFGTIFVNMREPQDYRLLDKKISDDVDLYRTMWIPLAPQWAYYDLNHPKISLWDLLTSQRIVYNNKQDFAIFSSIQVSLNNFNNPKLYSNIFSSSYGKEVLDAMRVKYLIIPKQVTEAEDKIVLDAGNRQLYIDEFDKISWLKKIDIGTENLVVYENENYKPPIYSFNNLFNFKSFSNLDTKYNFITNKLNEDFYFSINDLNTHVDSSNDLFSLFEDLKSENLDVQNKTISETIQISGDKKMQLYINKDEAVFKDNILLNSVSISSGEISLKNGENKFEYKDSKLTLDNAIENPSLESGAWQDKVSDCYNYDKNPILTMNLNAQEKSDGNQSLQLEATRHIACVSKKVAVKSGSAYLLSFDYQSPNSKIATYRLAFNDKEKTVISENIDVKDRIWNTFSKTIKIPNGSTSISLRVQANSVDEKTNIINRYDNFKLIEIPDFSDAYYLVSEPDVKLEEPKSITFDLINPTKKLVHIKGATTPFYLAMSESYHPQWQAQMNNEKINGFLASWISFVKPDKIAEEFHYKLNDFLNGWYVDTEKVCQNNSACTKNSDGSYDMEMVIEFFPQRWFYFGLLISGTTLLGCFGYLGYAG